MQLTQFSDYSLRLLLYLAAHPDRLVPIDEVSRAYGVSHHHLVKSFSCWWTVSSSPAPAGAAAACG